MDPFTADFFSNLAAGLTGQVINGLGGALKRRVAGTPAEQALRRSLEAGVVAAVAQSTADEPDHTALLHDILDEFFRDAAVGEQIALLLRGRGWDREQLAALFAEAGYEAERLPGLSLDAALDAFAGAFLEAADGEPELQGLIQIGQLRQQTGLQAELLAELKKLVTAWQSGRVRQVDKGTLLNAAGRPVYTLNIGQIIGRDQIAHADYVLSGNFERAIIHITNTFLEGHHVEDFALERKRLQAALFEYLKWVRNEYGRLNLRGVAKRELEVPDPELNQIYLSLAVAVRSDEQKRLDRKGKADGKSRVLFNRPGRRKDEGAERNEEGVSERQIELFAPEVSEPIDMAELLRDNPRLVITGGPGCGKTTYLHKVASTVAHAALSGRPQIAADELGLQGPLPLPIYITLGEYNRYCREQHDLDEPRNLTRYISVALRKQEAIFGLPSNFFERLLVEGASCMLLLDGLDEIADENERALVRHDVESLAHNKGIAYVLVTSRTRAYEGRAVLRPDMYHLVTVQPLSPDQVDRLAELWCKAIYPELDAPDEAASLQEEIRKLERHRADRGDDRLVDTPLLVAIVAIVHYNNHELPEKRAVLYDQCISALLAEKYKAPSEAGNRLAILGGSETEKRNTLALLAYRMMSAGRDAGRIVSESQLVDWLQPYFVRRYTEAKSEAQLAEFLDSMAGRASLLDERDRYYQFIHLTFQEYLAASYLNDTVRVLDEIIDFLAAENRLAESWWRETILLTAGYMALRSPDPALAFLQKLATLPANGELALAATELAGAGFLDQESLDESTSRLIADRLVSLLADSDLRAPNQLRGLAGVALGRLGDPRPDVACSVPDMVTISGGPFRMGSDKAKDSPYYDDLAYDDEVPNHEIVLPDYRIGRYPVTVAQYRVFVDEAKGYDHETFWTPTGWGWRQANKITQPRLWDDPQWTVDNHPVVSVSWHEAVAYCAWLRAETGRPFRLPDEAMWEKAARGTDARRWPWGSTWAATRLNAEGTIGRTSAVGIFPAGQSPYHICDAAGNVLEWCSGPGYRSGATYTNGFVRRAYAEDLALDADTRAVRGGSWLNNNQHTRAAFRDYDLPYDRDYGVGFRVAEYLSDPES